VARTDRAQGFFPPPRAVPQNEAQAREVPNATARAPAYAQQHPRPPVDAPQQAPQVYYHGNPVVRAPEAGVPVMRGEHVNAPQPVARGVPQPVARVVPQAPAPAPAPVVQGGGEQHVETRGGGEQARGSGGQGIQRGAGPDVRGGTGRER
jgi:hypothetical protein